jgi:putative endonuclease
MAEGIAACWLRLKGYQILARRYRTPVGEIDLIARKRSMLAFVEVKMRGDIDSALHAITASQRQRIERTARLFLARRPELARLDARFDALLLAPWRLPRHLVDAWQEATKPTS